MAKIIGRGRTSDVLEYSQDKVLKLFHEEFNWVARDEYDFARLVRSLDLAAPEVYELIELEGRKGIVYEFIDGKSMLDEILAAPSQIKAFARLLASVHWSIHSRSNDTLVPVREMLRDRIGQAGDITEEEKETIYAYLEKLPDGNSICHFDFHPLNILIGPGLKATVIDWITVCRGSPFADVCRTSLIITAAKAPRDRPLISRLIITLFKKRLNSLYLSEYRKLSGCKKKDIDQWKLPVAAARLAENIPEEKDYLMKIVRKGVKKAA
ncbi:phosphotransferase [Brucepastera parasyntrophica]|uniref:aminoglycoside phosphotransferase family protein n=1 Tax=Brucepastera parasyntrophica TaxID=2880008 RepID=UPI00210D85ED|nr:aminoglycoside phosphotransferase family protein [Brucepastera parasyntrophica]ULQ59050.1 phosphotransferase [Brucepastera parasyntrophica]